MTKIIKQIPVRGEYRTPKSITFTYVPGKNAVRDDGAVRTVYVITPDGIEVTDDAAVTAVAQYPYDVAIDEAATARLNAVVAETDEDEAEDAPPSTSGTEDEGSGDSPTDLSTLGVRELRKLATEKDIAGRSGMNKDALIAALA